MFAEHRQVLNFLIAFSGIVVDKSQQVAITMRIDYRYLTDNSNDPTKDFHDHIVSVSVVSRFNPTRPWTQQAAPAATR